MQLLRCQDCGFHFDPNVTATAVRGLYDDSYFRNYGGRGYTAAAATRRHEAAVRARLLQRYVSGGRLLEIGCASGFFLEAARRAGFDVLGIEPSETPAQQARAQFGVEVITGFIEDVDLPVETFDVACAWHVLEHIPDPLPTLERIRGALRPGGHLLLEVPNIASDRALRERSHWHNLDPRNHVGHFEPRALRALLERAGFEQVGTDTVAVAIYRRWPRSLISDAKQLVASRAWPFGSHSWKRELLRAVARTPYASESSHPAVIIPSHNGIELLTRLLPSLSRQSLAHEVIVVDNGSTDATGQILAERFPEARVVRLETNLGFGRALNRGVVTCSASTIVFLNNDVICEPRFLERICGGLDPARGVVMASGVLLQAERPDRIDSAGIELDRTLLASDYLRGQPADRLDRCVADPVGPCAGAAALDRAAFDAVGGFDEHFFAYLEDVDLVVRLIADGGRCRLVADARALHRHSATLGSGSRRKNELMGWGRGYTLAKYRLHRRPRLFVRALAAELAIATGQLLLDGTAVGFGARVRGFHAGLRVPPQPLPRLPTSTRAITLSDALRRRFRVRPRSRQAAAES